MVSRGRVLRPSDGAMLSRSFIAAIAMAAGLSITATAAEAFDDAQFPDWKGAWNRTPAGNPRFDPTKPRGLEQRAPLKPEFQALYEAGSSDQAAGGRGPPAGHT